MVAKEVYELGLRKLKSFDLRGVMPALSHINEGSMDDVLNINGCAFYQWLPGIVQELKPKQVVELGAAMGTSTLMILHNLSPDSKLYSITLPEHGLEFSYIKENYPNLVKIIGNDLDLAAWPKDLELQKTDLWFIDTEHTKEQLTRELDLYKPFFKKGATILLDDIHINEGMEEVWNNLGWDKFDATDPLHYSGFGICVV